MDDKNFEPDPLRKQNKKNELQTDSSLKSDDELARINDERQRHDQETPEIDAELLAADALEDVSPGNRGGYDQVEELVSTLGGMPADRRYVNEYIVAQIYLEIREDEMEPQDTPSENKLSSATKEAGASLTDKPSVEQDVNHESSDYGSPEFSPFNNKGRKK